VKSEERMSLSAAMRASVRACWQSTATIVCRPIPAVLTSRGGGKTASAGCRCTVSVAVAGTVAVEVLYCAAVQVQQHSWQALGMACDVLRWDETKWLAYLGGLCWARTSSPYDALAELAIEMSCVAS
jgi:hypothetical protein